MRSEIWFRTASGGDPVEYILSLSRGMQPTEGDCLYAAQRQRTRIVERTLNGIDVEGRPFEPYNSDRPYYYYPNGRVGNSKFTEKQNKAAVRRFLRKIADPVEHLWEIHFNAGRYAQAERLGGLLTMSGIGARFNSYADFKASLGRAGVDLMGPRAPHMLQSIAVKVGGNNYGLSDAAAPLGGKPGPATDFLLGIYGEPAGRAAGHNTGINPRWKTRHQRYFFGASATDREAMLKDLQTRILLRLKEK